MKVCWHHVTGNAFSRLDLTLPYKGKSFVMNPSLTKNIALI